MSGCHDSEELPPINYGVAVGEKKPGQTEIYRRPENEHELDVSPDPNLLTLFDSFLYSCSRNGDKEMLGTKIDNTYHWKTYNQIKELATCFGSGLMHLGLTPSEEHMGQNISFLGIYAKNREEWIIGDLACMLYKLSVVPFYDTLGPDSMRYILEMTNVHSILMTNDNLHRVFKLKEDGQASALSTIITMDALSEEERSKASQYGYTIYEMQEIIAIGSNNKLEYIPPGKDDLYTLCFTSGTTGYPKGVMLTHQNLFSNISSVIKFFFVVSTDVYISYMPLAHLYDRIVVNTMIYSGAAVGFYSGNPANLVEDLTVLKPTIFPAVPRVLNRFYDVIKAKINAMEEDEKKIAEEGLQAKLDLFFRTSKVDHPHYDSLVFNKFKKMLIGENVRVGLTSSAPISPEVLNFLRVTLSYHIIEAYGQTENAAAACACYTWDTNVGYVGGPVSCVELKLVDVPEMGYTSEDTDELGNLMPRGEVCLRGPSIFQGYFKLPEVTAEVLDEEGWLHTGDVAMLMPNKAIKIIDRKKDIFKIAQGEYIVPTRPENAYLKSKFLAQAFVHGDRLQHYLVGILMPDRVVCEKWAAEKGLDMDWPSLCKSEELKNAVMQDITEIGDAEKLNSLEKVKKISLQPELMSVDNNLLTPSLKLKRHQARIAFQDVIDALYAEDN